MSSDKVLMTTAEYAAHRKCSDSYVRRMRREVRLVLEGDLIDVAASDALLEATSDPLRGGDRTGKARPANAGASAQSAGVTATVTPGAEIGLREAMRRERLARARMAELELGEAAKDLVRRKHVDREVFTLARQALERLRTIPSRLRNQLAAESDARGCEALLDAEVAKVCDELQKAAQVMAAAFSGQKEAA